MNKKKRGRGRPKGEKTVVVRIPKAIRTTVNGIIKEYKFKDNPIGGK